jgi:uncharacterized protein (TIGR03435 family)
MRWAAALVLGISVGSSSALVAQANTAAAGSVRPSLEPLPSAFDVAAIHQNLSVRGRPRITSSPFDGNFNAMNTPLKMLLAYAWDLPQTQVLGGPDWLGSYKFDIQARTGGPAADRLHDLPGDQGKQQKQQMIRTLLADRFKLKAHLETRQMTVLVLVAGKGEPKINKSDEPTTSVRGWYDHIEVEGGDNTMAAFAEELSKRVGRVVIDKTGLKGCYDIELDWSDDDDNSDEAPTIFTAVKEQLGLRVESEKAKVPVLVVDHAEMPSEN